MMSAAVAANSHEPEADGARIFQQMEDVCRPSPTVRSIDELRLNEVAYVSGNRKPRLTAASAEKAKWSRWPESCSLAAARRPL